MNKFTNSFLPLNPAKTTAIGHSVMSGSRDANPSLSLAIMKCRLAHIRFVSHARIDTRANQRSKLHPVVSPLSNRLVNHATTASYVH